MHVALIQNVSFTDHRMVHTDNVAKELITRGYQVDVIINNSVQKTSSHDIPYTVICLPGETYSALGQIRFILAVYNLLRKKEYRIIHAKNPFSSVFPALFSGSQSQIIYDIRGLWIDFGVYAGYIPKPIAPILHQIDKYCMNKADGVIAISHELRLSLIHRGIKKNNIHVVIGDGVKTETTIEQKDIKDRLKIKGKVVGYVGTISKNRSTDKIIQAFNILREKSDLDTHLVLIGPISLGESNYFHALIKNMQLEDSISLTGVIPHNEVLQLLSSFDVAVAYHDQNMPMYNVAVPTKILEYLAAGCIIVTTDHEMYKNILTHEKDAILTAQNPKAFASGILYTLNNQNASQRISSNAIITARKFSIEKIVNKIEIIYQKLS